MVTSRVTRVEIPKEEPKTLPQEVLRLQSLLLDNGRKMLMERVDVIIKECSDIILKPRPTGMSEEETKTYYDDIERLKMRAECYGELKELPYVIMKEYWETEFTIDNSNKV